MSMNFDIAEYWYDLYDFLLENTLHYNNGTYLWLWNTLIPWYVIGRTLNGWFCIFIFQQNIVTELLWIVAFYNIFLA